MKKGYSLHIGLNKVNPEHYQNLKELRGALNDAQFMEAIADQVFGYTETRLLLDEAATSKNVLEILEEYSNKTNAGDVVLISYSGHGAQMEDPFFSLKDGDEPVDETWCLFDRQLIDDELFEAFRKFRSGVRIVIFSDSCHSGTIAREVLDGGENFDEALDELMKKFDFRSKELSPDESAEVFLKNKNIYKPIQEKYKTTSKAAGVQANVQLFAACQDNQIAFDGAEHGRFTTVLKNIIEQGRWQSDVDTSERLFNALRRPFSYPTPNFFTYGGTNSAAHGFPFAVEVGENNSGSNGQSSVVIPTPVVQPKKEEDEVFLTIEFQDGENNASKLFLLCPNGMEKIHFNDNNKNSFILEFSKKKHGTTWKLIHQLAQKADELKLDVDIEPLHSDNFPVEDDLTMARGSDGNFGYLLQWFTEEDSPHPDLGWHLGNEHSQLAAARDLTMERMENEGLENIRIGHIDTGILPTHPALSHKTIRQDLARTFIDKEKKDNPTAFDFKKDKGDIHGHGTGTLGILAGGKIDPALTEGIDIGFVGAIPFAEVVPMRTADTVIIFNNKNFCEAIDYALDTGCEVVTMSMGGKPSRKMAKKVDKAYEAGLTIVTAAGNNILGSFVTKLGPSTLIYPSKFPRVIAACGCCYNHCPYDFAAQKKHTRGLNDIAGAKGFDVQQMQGNWGPRKAMGSALAAYTPNTPWLTMDGKIVKSGGGTSSATPQIAAAAALWIVNNKEGLRSRGWLGTWKQVEAVRFALFNSADKSFAESEKYFGQGVLKAKDAILNFPIEKIKEEDLVKSKKSKSSWLGVTSMVKMVFSKQKGDESGLDILQRTMEMEIHDILFSTKDGIELLEEIDLSEPLNAVEFERMREMILKSDASGELKAFFE